MTRGCKEKEMGKQQLEAKRKKTQPLSRQADDEANGDGILTMYEQIFLA